MPRTTRPRHTISRRFPQSSGRRLPLDRTGAPGPGAAGSNSSSTPASPQGRRAEGPLGYCYRAVSALCARCTRSTPPPSVISGASRGFLHPTADHAKSRMHGKFDSQGRESRSACPGTSIRIAIPLTYIVLFSDPRHPRCNSPSHLGGHSVGRRDGLPMGLDVGEVQHTSERLIFDTRRARARPSGRRRIPQRRIARSPPCAAALQRSGQSRRGPQVACPPAPGPHSCAPPLICERFPDSTRKTEQKVAPTES